MSLKELLEAFIALPRGGHHPAHHVTSSRQARDRAHVLVGLAIAVANIDEVIELIRRAPDPAVARERLMARGLAGRRRGAADRADRRARAARCRADGTYQLSEAQARAILELRLQRLTGLERDKIADELRRGRQDDRGLSRAARRPRRSCSS